MIKEKLEKLFETNKGCLSSAQIRKASYRYHLNKLIEVGKVHKVRHGFFVHDDYLQYDEKILVAMMIPKGVFCLFTAWQLHELTSTVSYQMHLAVPRTTKISIHNQPPLALYYLSPKVYKLGISEFLINDQKVRCYNKERSVCDAVKFRNKTGEDVMLEVVMNYMKLKDRNLNLLLEYAHKLRITKIIMPYIKSML